METLDLIKSYPAHTLSRKLGIGSHNALMEFIIFTHMGETVSEKNTSAAISAVGIPRGGVAFVKGFSSVCSGNPSGWDVILLKDFLISALGIPRSAVTFFEGLSYFCSRNP